MCRKKTPIKWRRKNTGTSCPNFLRLEISCHLIQNDVNDNKIIIILQTLWRSGQVIAARAWRSYLHARFYDALSATDTERWYVRLLSIVAVKARVSWCTFGTYFNLGRTRDRKTSLNVWCLRPKYTLLIIFWFEFKCCMASWTQFKQ